jgi:hypothetical protein
VTVGKQWATIDLPIEDVQAHPSFQVRVEGLSQPHVNKLRRMVKGGVALDPIDVARVGKALYLLDGFHRIEASWLEGKPTITARVAKMSLPEARAEAGKANTKRGLPLSRKSKANVLAQYVGRGEHLDTHGIRKSAGIIEREINYIYGRETIRKKLNELGEPIPDDIEFPDGKKPWKGGLSEDDMGAEKAEEAEEALSRFSRVFFQLADHDQVRLLREAHELLGALERGERPSSTIHLDNGGLDL